MKKAAGRVGSVVLGMIVVASAAACGGGTGQKGGASSPSASDNKASSTTAVEIPGLSKLGHFASPDGMVRMVVDRTGAKAKIKLEGSNDIVELTTEEARWGGKLNGYSFIAPDGKRTLFVSVHGEMLYYRGEHDEVSLVRDGDATALGAPTVKGTPPPPAPVVKEKSPAEVAAAELEPMSVVKRFPQFKPEDSGNLAKVAEAYQLVTADMLFRCADHCGAWYAPFPTSYGNGRGGLGFVKEKDLKQGPATEEEKKGPLAKYNAWLRADYEFGDWSHQVVKSSWLAIFQLAFKTLPGNAPGIVWNVDKTDVIFVTPEGGRYWDSAADYGKPRFVKGLAPASEWPAPLQNNLLFREHVVEMNKQGLVDKKLADEVETIFSKWKECAQKVFVPAQKEIEANLTGNKHHYSATNTNSLVLRKYNDKAMQECGGKRAETILAQILTQREKDQKALFEKNKARITSLK